MCHDTSFETIDSVTANATGHTGGKRKHIILRSFCVIRVTELAKKRSIQNHVMESQ